MPDPSKMNQQEAGVWVFETLQAIETFQRKQLQATQHLFEWIINQDPATKAALEKYLAALQ
jgi:N-acetyl-anhydromuramyl-L-alanine amidase AmpD